MARSDGDVGRAELAAAWEGAREMLDAAIGVLAAEGLLLPRVSMDGAMVAWAVSGVGDLS